MISAYFNDRITVISQVNTDDWGTVSGSCSVYPARVVRTQRLVRDMKGVFVQANYTLYLSPLVSLNAGSLIVLADEPDACVSGEIVTASQKWQPVEILQGKGFAPVFTRVIL